ncbi:MAG TPA: hypothetical protein VFO58_25920 [Vicinamibacterales bacterium]|nr:hypothetical protein [Vicinamibacterales bacterium]
MLVTRFQRLRWQDGGELQDTVIETFLKVSQFWTYDPENYLKEPLYVR